MKIFKIILLISSSFFISSCINIIKSGLYKIEYYNNNDIKSVSTFEDGNVFLKNKNELYRIFPNTNVFFYENDFELKNGIILYSKNINPEYRNYISTEIKETFYSINEIGKAQFYKIRIPKILEINDNKVKIIFNYDDETEVFDKKLHLFYSDNDYNYYGLFIPFSIYHQPNNFNIDINLACKYNIFIKIKRNKNILRKDFILQTFYFNKKQSRKIRKYNRKKYLNEKKKRENIFSENNSKIYFSEGFTAPLINIEYITSEFASRREVRYSDGTFYGRSYYHTGLDIYKPKNTEVLAASGGKIRYADYDELQGNTVVIEHGLSLYTVYCHLNKILVEVNEIVDKGQVIGLVGETGAATGSHLHWEARIDGLPIDPRIIYDFNNIVD